jgi:RimK family alpha-L-glutamate ligase
MSAGHVVLIADACGWHERRLVIALRARGLRCALLSLSRLRVDLSRRPGGIAVPGFGAGLPDGVFVRSIAAGSFEQVTFRLSLLHALTDLGVPVFNRARAIECAVDKSMTSLRLRHAAIATPMTWVCEDAAQLQRVVLRESARGRRVVLKPLFGAQGRGLLRLGGGDAIPPIEVFHGVYYAQRFVDSDEACDYRVLVSGGRAVAAMRRRGPDWIHNVAQGAKCEPVVLSAELQRSAETASAALGLDYAGVDLMRDRDGEMLVLEVNSMPAWRGLQSVTSVDVAACLARDFAAAVAATRRRIAS